MDKNVRQSLGLYLWQIFKVKKIEIHTTGRKYPTETKWIYCENHKSPTKETRFLWYEVELLEN